MQGVRCQATAVQHIPLVARADASSSMAAGEAVNLRGS